MFFALKGKKMQKETPGSINLWRKRKALEEKEGMQKEKA